MALPEPLSPSAELQVPVLSARRLGRMSEWRIVLLGSLLFVSGSAIFYMMPAYLALIGAKLSLDAAQLGELAAIESLAIAITSLLGPLWIGRLDHRLCILVAAAACGVGDLLTAFAGSFDHALVIRFAVGLIGEGVLATISFTVLGAAINVDRAFAVALTAAVAFGAAVIAASNMLQSLLPGIGPLAPLAAIALAVLPCVGWLKLIPRWQGSQDAGLSSPRRSGGMAILALLGQAIWFGAPGAFWTFAEQVATDKGIPTATAELAVSIGELAGLAGSAVAAWQASRWGRLKPIAVATAGMIVTAVIYQYSTEAAALGLVLSLFYSFWNYGTVYQMGFVTELDRSGRAAVVMPAAQVFGQSVGPFAAGTLIVEHGDSAVTVATALFAAAGLGLYLVCFSRLRRANASPV